MTAEEHLAEVKRLATARLKAAALAAKHERLVLVDGGRLAALEALAAAVKAVAPLAKMTRDYKDVVALGDTYNGKRWLLPRGDMGEVFRLLRQVDESANLPTGALAGADDDGAAD
jgi:hypothetical protein